ncbi:DUF397 domain-containing protein [Flindersiella endophytica]
MDDLKWVKSSYSNGNGGGECVEVAWVKSSYSNGSGGGSCVEVAPLEAQQAVRDSKDPAGPMHVFDRNSWQAFLGSVKRGEFDLT